MISIKTNAAKLPVPPQKFQGSVSAPTPKKPTRKQKLADDLSKDAAAKDPLAIPAFLDAKTTQSAKEAKAAKGPLSQIAAAIKDGKEPPATVLKQAEKAPTKAAAAKKPAAKKTAAASSSAYDWEKAKTDAKTGSVPKLPPFVSYGPHLKKIHGFAVKGDAASIKQLTGKIKKDPCPPSRKNLFNYADLCLAAIKAKAA